MGLGAGEDAVGQGLLDGWQAVDGETLGKQGGEAVVELLGRGLGGGQLVLGLLLLAAAGDLTTGNAGGLRTWKLKGELYSTM